MLKMLIQIFHFIMQVLRIKYKLKAYTSILVSCPIGLMFRNPAQVSPVGHMFKVHSSSYVTSLVHI